LIEAILRTEYFRKDCCLLAANTASCIFHLRYLFEKLAIALITMFFYTLLIVFNVYYNNKKGIRIYEVVMVEMNRKSLHTMRR